MIGKKKKGIDVNMTFAKIMEKYPESIEVLMENGMHCIGCPAAMYETLKQGAAVHGLDSEKIVKEMNRRLKL